MGNGGKDQAPGQYRHCVEVGGGMATRGGDKLRPKCGKFYHHARVEAVVRVRGICTIQLQVNGVMGGSSHVAMPGADGDPPLGGAQCLD